MADLSAISTVDAISAINIDVSRDSRPHYNTIYIIIPFDKVTEQMVEGACENSIDSLRHTTSGEDKVFLKWNKYDWKFVQKADKTPEVLKASISDFKIYTYEEILVELKKPEWQSPEKPEQI